MNVEPRAGKPRGREQRAASPATDHRGGVFLREQSSDHSCRWSADVPLNVTIILRDSPAAAPDVVYVLVGHSGDVPLRLDEIEPDVSHRIQVLTP